MKLNLKLTKLGARMMRTAKAAAEANWRSCYANSVPVSVVSENQKTAANAACRAANEAEARVALAIIAAARRDPQAHILDLAVVLRCWHMPNGGMVDPAMHKPEVDEAAMLCLANALLAQGGIDESACDQDVLFNAMDPLNAPTQNAA